MKHIIFIFLLTISLLLTNKFINTFEFIFIIIIFKILNLLRKEYILKRNIVLIGWLYFINGGLNKFCFKNNTILNNYLINIPIEYKHIIIIIINII